MKKNEIKYHSALLEIIDDFKKPKRGQLISKNEIFNGLTAHFQPDGEEFKIGFSYDILSEKRKDLDIGQYHNDIEIQFDDSTYNLESVFLGNQSLSEFTGSSSRIHTKGFSEKQKYYFQLVVPLEKEMKFHFNIERTRFSTDIGYLSRNATTASIKCELIQACCIDREKKDFFLVLDSQIKQTFEEFADKANAVRIGLGYLSGYYAGNQGYYFAYTSKQKKEPKHFRVVEYRDSIISSYCPVYSNSHGYLHSDPIAEKYVHLLRPVSLKEFSRLCEKIHGSLELASTLMLMLESSIASLLFMPGGFAIALERLSDLVIGKKKLKLAPIKDKALNRKIRKELLAVLDKYRNSILPDDDLQTLNNRIDQLNQMTNKARLKAPFDSLKIELLPEDLEILDSRNDFLHGRVPDLTSAGANRPIERMNKDLFYASMRFYTLLNMLILKWIGYDNRVVNQPKIQEGFTLIKLDEEPYRQV